MRRRWEGCSRSPARTHQNLQEKIFNLKLSGNEVYCTNALLLLINIMLRGKFHYKQVQNRFFFPIKTGACNGRRGAGRSAGGKDALALLQHSPDYQGAVTVTGDRLPDLKV